MQRQHVAADHARNRGEQRGALDHVADVTEARDGAAHLALLVHHVLDHSAQVGVVRDDDVAARKVLALADATADAVFAAIVQAQMFPGGVDGLAPDRLRQLVRDRDREIERAAPELLDDRPKLDWDRDQPHLRRAPLEPA